tara:strand:+ start:1544 stop:2938 length:1395 start_codon:yes stop_codon:yes gene_type:complete
MRTFLVLILAVLFTGFEAKAQQTASVPDRTASLGLLEADQNHVIDLQITVDGLSYDAYWAKTFDAIFAFADSNSDGVLNETELRLVPSARAVRLSLGSGFTPPVASIGSLKEIVNDESQKCSKEDLRRYYLRQGAGRLQIGSGKLPHTGALTAALGQALDQDQDGRLSQTELQSAESTLRRLDTNDDELIGVGELIPNATYPGSWAANVLQASSDIDFSPTGDDSLVLKRFLSPSDARASEKAVWYISISDQLSDRPLQVATKTRCTNWSIPGPLQGLFGELSEAIAKAETEPPNDTAAKSSRARPSSHAWLTPLADRDGNGALSQQEINQWLGLQRQLIHGQLLISVYYGGGLFELLDANHDAGLSIRELKEMWQTLSSAGCTAGTHVDLSRVPNVVMFVVSQGYPDSLARTFTSDVEWFRLMDRNADGDVSRREFTGSPTAFDRLDLDHDGLISPREATKEN